VAVTCCRQHTRAYM